MAFNSDTYHENKARKISRERLAEARTLKATGANPEKVAQQVRSARLYARIAKTYAS